MLLSVMFLYVTIPIERLCYIVVIVEVVYMTDNSIYSTIYINCKI